MGGGMLGLHERVKAVRVRCGVSVDAAAAALNMTLLDYSAVEDGSRGLKGDELVLLADLCGVRVGAISGLTQVSDRVSDRVPPASVAVGDEPALVSMRGFLDAYFELDSYLDGQGFPAVQPAGKQA